MSNQVAEVSAKYLEEATASKSVPVGYKQTEVGVIPEDWDVVTIGEITDVKTGPFGSALHEKDYVQSGTPIITVEHLGEMGITYQNLPMVGDSDKAKLRAYQLNEGDIVFSRVGSIDRNAIVKANEQGWLFSGRLLRVKLKSKRNNPSYLSFHFHATPFKRRVVEVAVGQTMPSLNTAILKNILVVIPQNEKEQTAIANALSDVNALISELEKLITKKQAIKIATMQQLLTGRTRLPQFALREDGTPKGTKPSELGEIPEDWEVLGFGALFQSSVSKKPIKPMSLVSFVGMQDVTEQAQLSTQYVLAIENVKSGFTYFERGDVLVAKITPCFENGKGCHTETLSTDIGFGSTEFHVLRATDNSDSRFIYYWSNRNVFRKSLESEMVGSAGHRRVPLSAIAKYTIPVPSKEEQTAIATILSDMDTEIQALEQRLSKTRQIKQGMMQELLTGKTRLATQQV